MQPGRYQRNNDILVVGQRVYRSAGVGGGITGKGCNIGIIDDPIKTGKRHQHDSEKTWEWYNQPFYTRPEKDAYYYDAGIRVSGRIKTG